MLDNLDTVQTTETSAMNQYKAAVSGCHSDLAVLDNAIINWAKIGIIYSNVS